MGEQEETLLEMLKMAEVVEGEGLRHLLRIRLRTSVLLNRL